MSYYERLERRLLALTHACKESLAEADLVEVEKFIGVREYGVALEHLCDALGERLTPVPSAIAQEAISLAQVMGLDPNEVCNFGRLDG